MKVTILGSGSSSGVPMVGEIWGACDPREPRNRRRRASILVESGETAILVDSSPDCRQQLLDARVSRLDAIIYTHAHADHTHGIDDLRWVNVAIGAPLPAFGDANTLKVLGERFGYAFEPLKRFPDRPLYYYKPVLEAELINGTFEIGGLTVVPFEQDHGFSVTQGLRIGNFAYSTDVLDLDEPAFEALDGVDTWVVDAFRYKPHPTHSHVSKTLAWIQRVKPRHAVLCHMGTDLDYQTLRQTLPSGVEPAYDGMVLEI